MDKTPKSDIGFIITGAHKYNTRSSTKRVNHVTTFKNAPNMFKMDAAEKNTHRHRLIFLHRPEKEKIKVEPTSNQINCETTGKIS